MSSPAPSVAHALRFVYTQHMHVLRLLALCTFSIFLFCFSCDAEAASFVFLLFFPL